MSWYSRRSLIIFLLLVAAACFAYVKKEMFFRQAKKPIEQNLARSLNCQLAIGRINPGIFGGLVLEEVEMSFPQNTGFVQRIRINRAYLDYNLWQALFSSALSAKKMFAAGDLTLELEGGQIYFAGAQRALLNGIEGKLLITKEGLYFQDIKACLKDTLRPALKINGKLSETSLAVTANIDHLKIGDNLDLLSNFALTLDKKLDLQNNSRKVSATLRTYGSVLNRQPFPELNSSFEIQDNKLRILALSLGANYDLRGIVILEPPFEADLCLNLYQARLTELISCFNLSEEPNLSGTITGLVQISGPLKQPKVEGYLEARDGRIGDLDFVSANVNIKGRYPKISIVDSRVMREEESFILEGEADLINLEKHDSVDIQLKPDKGMFWQGWDITRQQENRLRMSKNVSDDFKVSFDAFMEDEFTGFSGEANDNEMGLTYRILDDKMIKLRLKKEEEILGIEQRVRF